MSGENKIFNYISNRIMDLSTLPQPARNLMNLEKYLLDEILNKNKNSDNDLRKFFLQKRRTSH